MRRHLIALVLALLASGSLVATAMPAGAGLSDAEERFCTGVNESGQNISESLGDNSEADTTAEYYRELAKVAPKKSIKKALKTMANYYGDFADVDDDDVDAIQDFVTGKPYLKFAKASGKVQKYMLATCVPGV